MLCIAAEATPTGYVILNGHPLSPKDIAHEVREPLKVVRALIEELERNGVFSRDRAGRIFCRRMVKAEVRRQRGEFFGKMGGNPALLEQGRTEKELSSSNGEAHEINGKSLVGIRGSGKAIVDTVVEGKELALIERTEQEEVLSIVEWFDRFYLAFPRRVARRAAERAFLGSLKRGNHPADIIAGAIRYAKEREGEDASFTKHPATWLNGDCHKDEAKPKVLGRSLLANLDKV